MEKGEFVKIDYIGRLESGEIFDLTKEDVAKKENVYNPKINYKPVPLVVGAGFTIKGIEKALENMKVGEKKEIEVSPKDGFGKRNPEMIRTMPKKVFEGKVEPVQGLVVDFSGMKGRVQSVSGGRVTVDFNNPLSGKTLKYEIEVREKIENDKNKVESILEFFGIENVNARINNDIVDIEGPRIPNELKDRVSKLIIDYVKPDGKSIEKIRFIDTIESPEKSSETESKETKNDVSSNKKTE
jgi:FKBP-type peptidyl-prolyl cis-trans isomerase SlyD